jgi:hypothetical protein
MMGIAQYNRKEEKIRLVQQSAADVLARLFSYASTHLVYKKLSERSSTTPAFSVGDVAEILKTSSGTDTYGEKTWRDSASRMLQWMRALGLIRWEQDDQIVLIPNPVPPKTMEQLLASKRPTNSFIFKADAPPQRVLEVLARLVGPGYSASQEDRNSLNVLRSLNIISSSSDPSLIERPGADLTTWLAARALNSTTMRKATPIAFQNPDIPAIEIGQIIEDLSGQKLADSSKVRYGHGILGWVRWVQELVRSRSPTKPKE